MPHFIGRANLMRQQVQDLRIPEDKKEAAIAAANSPSRGYTGYVGVVVSGVFIHAVVAGMLFAFGLMTRVRRATAPCWPWFRWRFFPTGW